MSEVERGIESAVAYLLSQGALGFPDAAHVMHFPAWAGFTAEEERQESDTFSRAIIAGAVADIAAALGGESGRELLALARSEAAYVASQARPSFVSPFSYFPGLPELPPDTDTLAAVILLFASVSPERLPALEPALDMLESLALKGGLVPTWLIHPEDPAQAAAKMSASIARYWGRCYDAAVNARAALALRAAGRPAGAKAITNTLAKQAMNTGVLEDRWYFGVEGPSALCLEALKSYQDVEDAQAFVRKALIQKQHPDGGWGPQRSGPVQTAQALEVLCDDMPVDACQRGIAWLLDYQRRDGAWNATTWIKMEIRGPDVPHSISGFGSKAVTTAFALRALCQAWTPTMEKTS